MMGDILKLGAAFLALGTVLFIVLGGEFDEKESMVNAETEDIETKKEEIYNLIEESAKKKKGVEIKDPKHHEWIKELVKKGELNPHLLPVISSVVPPEEELTAGGFPEPVFYKSNLYLHHALTGGEILASKPEELENDYDVQHVLKATKDFLMKIKYDGEKKGDLEKVIDDIDKAIQEGANFGDPILKEIHKNLKELNDYFNV